MEVTMVTTETMMRIHPEWSMACPVCPARYGQGCVTPDGYPRGSHKKRVAPGVRVSYRMPGEPFVPVAYSARHLKTFGGQVMVESQDGHHKFWIAHRDNWGDERFPWVVSANIVVGTDGAHDMPVRVDEFPTLRAAIADAKRRVRERDYSEAA